MLPWIWHRYSQVRLSTGPPVGLEAPVAGDAELSDRIFVGARRAGFLVGLLLV